MRIRETCGLIRFGVLAASCVLIGAGYREVPAAESAGPGRTGDSPPPRTSMSDPSIRYSAPSEAWQLIAPHFQPPPDLAGKLGDYRSLLKFEDGTPVKTAADWPPRPKKPIDAVGERGLRYWTP